MRRPSVARPPATSSRAQSRRRVPRLRRARPDEGEVDLDTLADMATTLVEGGLILGRALQDVAILPKQILLYRDFVRSLFAPKPAAGC